MCTFKIISTLSSGYMVFGYMVFLALFRLYGLWKTFSLKLYAISEIWSFWLCGQF